MKSKLFWKLFWAFLATLLLTATVLSSMVVVLVRAERQRALENEVLLQARDVARLFKQVDTINFWRSDRELSTIGTTLIWKLNEIRASYGAEVWIASANAQSAFVLDERAFYEKQIEDADVIARIEAILSGQEIRVQGLMKELDPDVVTLGVPTVDSRDQINGAVLMHVSIQSLRVDYKDILRYALIAAGVALVLGTAMAYFISRRQTRPLQMINQAVTEFARGQMDSRVEIRGDDEITQLARSINQMAEDLSRLEASRRSFVASVSHELRSPLTCISGFVQGMLDGTIPGEEREKYLEIVKNEAARLTKLCNELLDLSKFESGDFPLNVARFDVNELIRVELLKFEQHIEEKRLDVDVDFAEAHCAVEADADRIRQVVTNLIDNAVKFAPEGGELRLSVRTLGKLCHIEVSNTGEGIPPPDQPFVFDRFFKGDKAHTSGLGSGLGLSIVKRIVEQHGQTIKLASGANLTTLSFTLPKADAETDTNFKH